jgi:hypothetical protein
MTRRLIRQIAYSCGGMALLPRHSWATGTLTLEIPLRSEKLRNSRRQELLKICNAVPPENVNASRLGRFNVVRFENTPKCCSGKDALLTKAAIPVSGVNHNFLIQALEAINLGVRRFALQSEYTFIA